MCFPVDFVKFLRIPFLRNTSRQLHLFVIHLIISFCKEVLYICSNPALDNVFMCHFENIWLENRPSHLRQIDYRRLVDDTFFTVSIKE